MKTTANLNWKNDSVFKCEFSSGPEKNLISIALNEALKTELLQNIETLNVGEEFSIEATKELRLFFGLISSQSKLMLAKPDPGFQVASVYMNSLLLASLKQALNETGTQSVSLSSLGMVNSLSNLDLILIF